MKTGEQGFPMNKYPFKRRKVIVDPYFQYRFIGKIGVLALLIILMSLSFLAAVQAIYGDMQVQVLQPDPFGSPDGGKVVRGERSILGLIWPIMGVAVLITLVITFLFALITSHRLAGPVFRIRKVLEAMADGDLSGEVRLREKDAFINLADSINHLKGKWRDSIQGLKEIIPGLDIEEKEKRQQALNRLEGILRSFKME